MWVCSNFGMLIKKLFEQMYQLCWRYKYYYSDFSLLNGKCEKGIKNCQEYEGENHQTCSKCKEGFSLVSNLCLRNTIIGCKNEQAEVCE